MTIEQTRIALDSNILIYAEGAERHSGDQRKIGIAQRLLDVFPAAIALSLSRRLVNCSMF